MENNGITSLKITRGRNPRRNLPVSVARKRGESNYLRAFERAYLKTFENGIVHSDFGISGYGIPDLVLMSWATSKYAEEGSALGVIPKKVRVVAFELKLKDWRKALKQAFRYSYFADEATVVLPPDIAVVAMRSENVFRVSNIALWSFDKNTGTIERLIKQSRTKARSQNAKNKAIDSLLKSSKLGVLLK